MDVYALRSDDVETYPRQKRTRARGGFYYMYGPDGRKAALRDNGGYEGLRDRLRSRATTVARLQRMLGYAGARLVLSR